MNTYEPISFSSSSSIREKQSSELVFDDLQKSIYINAMLQTFGVPLILLSLSSVYLLMFA